MLKQFYRKALPGYGTYCVTGIHGTTGKITNYFEEDLDGVLLRIDLLNNKGNNTFVALGSFDGHSRKKDNCIFYRSFYIDLDVGEDKALANKGYIDKQAALDALDKFLEDYEIPPPIRIDSGTGIHAYWLLDKDIPFSEYEPYAQKFKEFVLPKIHADPAVMADGARIMRCPNTLNHKTTPPSPSGFITDDFGAYSFEDFKNLLGEIKVDESLSVLNSITKGLDEDTKAILKSDNFAFMFSEIAIKSCNGSGCEQIKNLLVNSATVSRDLWTAGLTIAVKCADGETAIHDLSNNHPSYNYNETIKTANSFEKPRTCEWFTNNNPELCDGCKLKGKFVSPISLGRAFQPAKENETYTVRNAQDTKSIPSFPKFLKPFVRGENGGIYHVPPPKVDKDGVQHSEDPVLIIPHDLYPIQRLYSPLDGECLTMRLVLPNDAVREFLLPMKDVYSQEKFKSAMASNGVLYNPLLVNLLTHYIVKWGQYMISKHKADIMRMQMGWTEERIHGTEIWNKRSFVVGKVEICNDGTEIASAASPYVKGTAKHLLSTGSYEAWQKAANQLDNKGLELHAFTMLGGFGSPLMCYTSTAGVAISLLGRSGCAKTGALYAGLSVFGNPKDLSVFEATDNGMTGRYLALHNLMLGVDEIGNKDPKVLSQLIHKVSHGKAKIKMQASVNAEREHEMAASLIAVFTTNESVYNKLEGIKASPDGEAARLIEFFVKKPDILGGVNGGERGRQIFDTFRFNYGHAGIRFIKETYMVGDNYILDTMDKWRARFVKDFCPGDNVYRFYENLIQANMTAGEIATNAGIITLDLERVYDAVTEEMIHIKDKVITVNKIDYQSVLGDFVNKFMASILIIKEGRVTMEPRGQLVARVDTDASTLQVSRTIFKQYLAERNVSSREFETVMRDLRLMAPTDARVRLTSGWKTAVSLEPVWCYVFPSVIPAEWFENGIE